jgi:hypothetical protein
MPTCVICQGETICENGQVKDDEGDGGAYQSEDERRPRFLSTVRIELIAVDLGKEPMVRKVADLQRLAILILDVAVD